MTAPLPATAPRSRRPATTEAELAGAELVADDDAEPDAETGPLRRCLVTRERLAKDRMIRFVLGPDQRIVPDLAARLPGRGIWLSARGDVLETARAQGSLARAFAKQVAKGARTDATKPGAKVARGAVTLTPDLADRIEAMLLRRVVELLGLARRAGQAVCGFQKAREWLTCQRAGLVVQASDGSPEERARFLSGVAANDLGAPDDLAASGTGDTAPEDARSRAAIPVGSPLPAAALGAVFGRDHVVHVVVAPGRLAEALTCEIARLCGVKRRAEPGRKDAKAGRKAAGGDAGKTATEQARTGNTGTGQTGLKQRAGA